MRIKTLAVILLVFGLFNLTYALAQDNLAQVKIGNQIFNFETARTEKELAQGLKFRKTLARDSGMLFIYSQEQFLYFYMKDTQIPLDIAFIDENYTIVDIQELEPFNEVSVCSKMKAKYALEVNRGFFKHHQLRVNSRINLIFSQNK